ncbi:MAG: sulfite exporter TauE/SafE family protein [Pseudomonadota bacterium]
MIEALGIPWTAALGVLAAYFLGGIVKGGLGFGLPLVTISMLPLFVAVDLAIAVNAVILPFINLVQIHQARRTGEALSRFWPLLATLALFMPLGIVIGTRISAEALTLALGLAVMAFTAFQWANPRLAIPARWERRGAAVTGVMAGVSGGLLTINGPFFVLFLVGRRVERAVMMAGLGLFFLTTGLLLTIGLSITGTVTGPRALAALACLVPAFAGMALGDRLARRVEPQHFRTGVLAGLMILGANITARGLGA